MRKRRNKRARSYGLSGLALEQYLDFKKERFRITTYDLSSFTYDEVVKFIFRRFGRIHRRKHPYSTLEADPVQVVQWLTKLFRDSPHLHEQFNYKQLERGFESISFNTTILSVEDRVWDKDIPRAFLGIN